MIIIIIALTTIFMNMTIIITMITIANGLLIGHDSHHFLKSHVLPGFDVHQKADF